VKWASMNRPADIVEGRQWRLTRDEIVAIGRRAFGASAHVSDIYEVFGGTINSTYLLAVTDTPLCVLRVAPSITVASAGPSWLTATSLRREHALTPFLAPVATLLPRTLAADFSHQLIDRDWLIQTIVPGTAWTALESRLTTAERADLWRQLGGLAASLHAVVGDDFGPPERPRRHWSDVVSEDLAGMLHDWFRFDLPNRAGIIAMAEAVARRQAVLEEVRMPHLVHSDLDPRHVFVDRGPDGALRITGLIDHEYGRFADPASEGLLTLLAHKPPEGSESFWERYGPAPSGDASRWRSLLYRAIGLGWEVTDSAHRGDDKGTEEALTELESGVLDAVISS
jgi:Ser/Thr protein kinase RdoA (MazF antagonist)